MEAEETTRVAADVGPEPGEVLDGRFEVLEQVGRGGVGSVYRARRVKLELPLAIKLLHQDSAQNEELRLRFEREAHAMASLSHPNIVSVTDFGVWQGRPYLVMEYLEGKTLYERMQQGPLPIDELVHIATQLLRGVAHAHSKGLVHRDLKPANVFLQQLPDQPLHVKVLDFGFAKFLGDQAPGNERDLTKAGVVFGTPAYMSPEQAVGEAMDARTDVYALGVILYEMLTGSRPFKGDYPELTRQKLTEPVPPFKERAPGLRLKPALEKLVLSCLARDRSERPADAAALLEAFEALPSPPAMRVDPSGERLSRASEAAVEIAGRGARVAAGASGKLLATLGQASLKLLAATGRLSQRGLRALVARFGWARVGAGAAGLAGLVAIMLSLRAQPAEPSEGRTASSVAASDDANAARRAGRAPGADGPAAADPPGEAASGARTDTDTDTETEGESAADPSSAATGDGPVVKAPAANPWQRRALPAPLDKIRKRILRGQDIAEADVKTLRAHLREVRDDPRPALLIAYAYVRRQWYADAITWYRTAHAIDAGCRGDARMLRELVELVQIDKVRAEASAALLDFYGAEAVQAVERHLKRARLTEAERQALLSLRDRLRAHG